MSPNNAPSPPLIAPEKIQWKAAPNFEKNVEGVDLKHQPRMNLSGAACVPTDPKFRSCLVANDEKKYAQFFTIDGNTLTPGKLIRLYDGDKDPDFEGVAYDDEFYYVTGSHGRSRNSNDANDSSYVVVRFAVNRVTGMPSFEPNDRELIGVETSFRLRDEIGNADRIKDFFNKPLADGGVNIEGIAVQKGRMHFGLRGPSLDGSAFVLSVEAGSMFTKNAPLRPRVTSLPLGESIGIRDLATLSEGLLILAGPTREESVPYTVWSWDGVSVTARQLATLDLSGVAKGAKAEILPPLEEDSASVRVLVMFDGLENGGAISFKIPR